MNTPDIPAGPDWDVLAGQPIDAVDVENLSRVATMFSTVDPVPHDLVERLKFAISLDALEVELAVLQLSSDQMLTNRADSTSSVESMTFASGRLTTTITVSADGPDRVRIDGWIAPSGPAAVELHQGAGQHETTADDDGRFVFTDVPHGLTRFMIRPSDSDGRPVATPAVEI